MVKSSSFTGSLFGLPSASTTPFLPTRQHLILNAHQFGLSPDEGSLMKRTRHVPFLGGGDSTCVSRSELNEEYFPSINPLAGGHQSAAWWRAHVQTLGRLERHLNNA
jgi:hypothetical protein